MISGSAASLQYRRRRDIIAKSYRKSVEECRAFTGGNPVGASAHSFWLSRNRSKGIGPKTERTRASREV
jgi:hypothetical protein